MQPAITCVIPCFNAKETLRRAIESCLSQPQFAAVIVVDDVSSDGSFELAGEIARTHVGRVLAIRNAVNRGPAVSRNNGARMAPTEFLCFLDSDDEYLQGFGSRMQKALLENPSLAAVKSGIEIVATEGSSTLPPSDPRHAAASNSYPCNMLVRRAVFDLLGGFPIDERFRGPVAGEDIAFIETLQAMFTCGFLSQPLVRHYNRPNSHLEKFLARTEVHDGKIVFMQHPLEAHDVDVLAGRREYFERARRRVEAIVHSLRKP